VHFKKQLTFIKGSIPMKDGKREGAGRRKGVPNRAAAARESAIAASGLIRLEYMLTRMRDETKPIAVRLMAENSFIEPDSPAEPFRRILFLQFSVLVMGHRIGQDRFCSRRSVFDNRGCPNMRKRY
jgi:hypothetical protein